MGIIFKDPTNLIITTTYYGYRKIVHNGQVFLHSFGCFICVLVSFHCDLYPCTMLLHTSYTVQRYHGHVRTLWNPYIHTNAHTPHYLYSLRKHHYIASLDCNMFLDERTLYERNFLGKGGGKYMPQSWDQNKGIHNQLLKPLPEHNIAYWRGKATKNLFTNIQSHKQIGHVSTPYGISKHRYWLHHKDLDQQHNRSRFSDITSQTSWIYYHLLWPNQ